MSFSDHGIKIKVIGPGKVRVSLDRQPATLEEALGAIDYLIARYNEAQETIEELEQEEPEW